MKLPRRQFLHLAAGALPRRCPILPRVAKERKVIRIDQFRHRGRFFQPAAQPTSAHV